MKFTLSLILFIWNLSANADIMQSQASALERLNVSVNDFLQEYSQAQTLEDPVALAARSAYVSAMALPIANLEPEDFNVFLLSLIDLYITQPQSREALFILINEVRAQIAPELAARAAVEDGPRSYIVQGATQYSAYLMVGGLIAWKTILTLRNPRAELMRQARQGEASVRQNLLRRPMFWTLLGTTGAGASLGYVEYMLENHKTHPLDPILILNVAQTQLACSLSYEALNIEADANKEGTDRASLNTRIANLLAQTMILQEQFDRLENLYVDDYLFQRTLQHLPPAENFLQLRANLTDAGLSQDGMCRQVSLEHLDRVLNNLKVQLEFSAP